MQAAHTLPSSPAGPVALWQWFIRDARHFQVFYLGIFLLYGTLVLGWETAPWKPFLVAGSAVLTQYGFILSGKADMRSLKSALITGLGLSILLRANEPLTLVLAAAIAIASKFAIRHQGKHIFNPANIGIVAVILLTGDAWISPGQWGSSVVLIYFITAAALMILLKVGRIDTSLMFIGTVFLLEYFRTILYLGWGWDVLLHKFGSGSFLLFAFFMITDPVTTPKNQWARLAWAGAIGGLSFYLSQWMQVYTAPLWALIIVSPFTALLNHYFRGATFQWIR